MRNSKYAESSGKMDAILHVCKFTRSQNLQLYFHPRAKMCDFLQKIKSRTWFSTEKSDVFVQKNQNVNLTFTESLHYHLTTKIRAERKNYQENQKERKDCFIEPQLVWCATLYHFWRIFLVSFDPGALSPKWATNWNK